MIKVPESRQQCLCIVVSLVSWGGVEWGGGRRGADERNCKWASEGKVRKAPISEGEIEPIRIVASYVCLFVFISYLL